MNCCPQFSQNGGLKVRELKLRILIVPLLLVTLKNHFVPVDRAFSLTVLFVYMVAPLHYPLVKEFNIYIKA